jgi:hypothetical protein
MYGELQVSSALAGGAVPVNAAPRKTKAMIEVADKAREKLDGRREEKIE